MKFRTYRVMVEITRRHNQLPKGRNVTHPEITQTSENSSPCVSSPRTPGKSPKSSLSKFTVYSKSNSEFALLSVTLPHLFSEYSKKER